MTTSGTYTFTVSGNPNGVIFNLYSGIINPSSFCTNWVGSNYTIAGGLTNIITKTLAIGTYYLMVSSFSSTQPVLPANYVITPSGGTIYSNPLSNDAYSYTNIVVNSAGNIVAFSDNSDLTNTTTYPSDVYTVYGLSYQGGLTLNPYVGTSFSSFQTLLTNNTVCGRISSNSKTVTINCVSAPAQPSAFTASSTTVCQGQNNVTYTIPAVAGATSYNWSYTGTGHTINGSGTSVTINFSNAATQGTLSVTANNTCGNSTARTLAITVNQLPAQPNNFTTSTATVCQGASNIIYTVPTVSGATSYTWTYSGTGVSTTGTNNSITLNFSSTATQGTLSVVANNACGPSTARTLSITVNSVPPIPDNFTAATATVCQGQNNVTYTIPAVAGATSYSWSYSGAGVPTITGTGRSVTISFSNTATSGTLSVFAVNACGNGSPRTYPITVNSVPPIPDNFTAATPTVCQGQNNVTYTIPAVAGATSYSWSYSGNGVAPITGTTTSININFSNTATSGTLSVFAVNACGNGSPRTYPITVRERPTATLTGTQTIVSGQAATLTATLTGESPWTITVNNQNYNVTTSTYQLSVTPTTTTIYTLSSVSNVCATLPVTTNNSATVTVSSQSITTNITGSTFCAGTTVTGTYSTTGTFGSGNTLTAQLSDATGSFSSPVSLGTVSGGTISATIPSNTPAGNGYRIRVVSSNPAIAGTANTSNLTINVPANATLSGTQTIFLGQIANLTVSLTGTSPWTIVISGNTTTVTTSPSTYQVTPPVGVSTYTLTSVNNVCGTTPISTNNVATVTVNASTISTNITGSTFCAGTTVTGTYSTTGTFGGGNTFTAQLSDASGSFSSPVSLSTVSGGTISATIPPNTPAGTGYRIRVVSSNPAITGTANTSNLTINVPANATLSGTQTVTQGQPVNLTVNLTGTSPWIMVVNGNTTTVTTTPYSYGVTPGVGVTTYTLTTVSNVCGTTTVTTNNTATVTVNPPVACDNDFSPTLVTNTNGICPNESAVLRVLDAPFGYNYSWSLNSSVIPNQSNPVLIANQVGTYQAQLTPEWYQVEPKFTNEILNDITFINENIGFIVGRYGTILRTDDLGEKWSEVYLGNPYSLSDLKDIHFTSSDNGWIVGHSNTLIKSSTGGISWESQSINFNGNAIDFFDKLKGIIVGTNGNIRYTIDGGQTWNTAISGISTNLNDIKFISSNIAIAVGDGGKLIKSIDGGQTWSSVFTGITFDFKRIYFFNSSLGWIVGNNDTVLRTTDGGIGWNSVTTGITINGGSILSWKDVSFSNASTGWLVDGGNTLAKTNDGGNTWSISTRFTSLSSHGITINQCSKLYFSKTSQNGFVIGWPGAIAKTIDLGNNWSAKNNAVSKTANDVQFIDNNNVISVGDDALVQKSSDKGKTWTTLTATGLTGNDWLNGCHFINLSTGWAIDNGGDIFFTNNGGLNWSKQRNAPSFQILYDIHMFNATKGYVVGLDGLFLETNDGGANWTTRSLGYSSSFLKIQFIDNNNGWICGQNGLILKTSDGGNTWLPQTTNTTAQISTIFFLNSQIGWATVTASSSQSIIKTTDGGNTWNVVSTTPTYVTDIVFKNTNDGYISGGNRYLATTTNGGVTWVQINQFNFDFSEITKLTINSLGTALGVGTNNTILRFNPNACAVNTNTVTINNITTTSNITLSGANTVSPYTTKSANTIQSTQGIVNGQVVNYRAGSSITLNPGFKVDAQTIFNAEIRGCNN
jgi:photosystem II stability/assembly factor-like uncharacterized protein